MTVCHPLGTDVKGLLLSQDGGPQKLSCQRQLLPLCRCGMEMLGMKKVISKTQTEEQLSPSVRPS